MLTTYARQITPFFLASGVLCAVVDILSRELRIILWNHAILVIVTIHILVLTFAEAAVCYISDMWWYKCAKKYWHKLYSTPARCLRLLSYFTHLKAMQTGMCLSFLPKLVSSYFMASLPVSATFFRVRHAFRWL